MDFNKEGLTRQGSVYNLTFDEFQSSMGGLGKDFGSMNMDELLKNIWTAEESQAMAAANPAPPPGGGGIQRQGSVSLPRTLSQKTVDEVWRDLVRENTNTGNNGVERVSVVERNVISNNGNNNGNNNNPGRQQTLGEMTLEEFLVRAGVDINLSNQLNNNNIINNTTNNNINPSNNMNNTINTNNNASSSNTSLFFSNNTLPVMPMPIPIQAYSTHQVMTLPTNGMMPCVNATTKNNNNNINNNGNNGEMSSSLSPVGYTFGGGGKKGGGPVEKVVERRQRRMIKNRESAARSRARKQAYTIELEAEVAKLKEQNEELQKKQQEIMEMQKNQSMEKINPQQSGPKKRCLRRTQTGPW